MNAQHDKNDEHTFVNDNPDTAHPMDKKSDGNDNLDSDVNTNFTKKSDGKESLTNDESVDTDPNEVANKPTFRNDSH